MTFHTQRLQFVFLAALTSLGSLLGITGCTTTGNPPAANPDTPPPLARLSRRDSATADALAHFSEGVMAEYSRNYPAALSNYMDAVRYDPENEDLNLRIVIGLLQQKREAEALKTAEAYSRRHPKSEKSLVCLALIYRAANRLNDV